MFSRTVVIKIGEEEFSLNIWCSPSSSDKTILETVRFMLERGLDDAYVVREAEDEE